jgi:hypothetical protein
MSTQPSASIRIIGNDLVFETISNRLGVSPTHTHKAREVDKYGNSHTQDMWLLESPLGKQNTLDEHLKWLTRCLAPSYEYLKELKNTAKVDIFCSYTSIGDGGLSLSPESLRMFYEIDLKLEISIILLKTT